MGADRSRRWLLKTPCPLRESSELDCPLGIGLADSFVPILRSSLDEPDEMDEGLPGSEANGLGDLRAWRRPVRELGK